jgi:glucosamine 6-phosphate synthetase-like amidotransferase/phosphosugar isomerase protein
MNKKRINVIKEKVEVLLNPIEPYRFFFEQEINQQPEAILKCMGNGSRLYNSNDSTKLGGLEINSENIKNIHHLLIIGCGSSYFAG